MTQQTEPLRMMEKLHLIILGICGVIILGIICLCLLLQRNINKQKNDDVTWVLYDNQGIVAKPPHIDDAAEVYISIVVPAYNESERLPVMLEATFAYLKDTVQEFAALSNQGSRRPATAAGSGAGAAKGSRKTYAGAVIAGTAGAVVEVIVVDDGSKDDTFEVVRRIQQQQQRGGEGAGLTVPTGVELRALKLSRNAGKGGAVRAGVTVSRGSYVLMADADAATDIRDLSNLLTALKKVELAIPSSSSNSNSSNSYENEDAIGMAVGSRAHLEKKSMASRELHRTILMLGFHALVCLLCTQNVKDTQCGFKLFTRRVASTLFKELHLQRWAFDVELIYVAESLGVPLCEVSVTWHEVPGSKLITTKWDIVTTSISMALDMLTVRLCFMCAVWKMPKL